MSPYRVQCYIPTELKEVTVLIYKNSFESTLEYVPCFVILPVIFLRVYAIELPHAPRKISFWSLNNKVVMVVHKAPGMTEPMKPFNNCTEELEEYGTVLIRAEYLLSCIPPGGDVIQGSGIFNP